jgi:hypothetical protein
MESMKRSEPKKGEIYKHFKGNYYEILCVGHHSETRERMVVYRRMITGENFNQLVNNTELTEPCIRPLEMFLSEVDHAKYPDANQKYRFTKVIKCKTRSK